MNDYEDEDFEWDLGKARYNYRKHDVSFEEAATIFRDWLLLVFPDDEHSDEEERLINIGKSKQGRILTVITTERGIKSRLISARKANAEERTLYELQ